MVCLCSVTELIISLATVDMYLQQCNASTLDGDAWSASHPGERSRRYSLDRRLGGPQSRSGHGDEEKNTPFLSLPETGPS
jgi:hypothetical protein